MTYLRLSKYQFILILLCSLIAGVIGFSSAVVNYKYIIAFLSLIMIFGCIFIFFQVEGVIILLILCGLIPKVQDIGLKISFLKISIIDFIFLLVLVLLILNKRPLSLNTGNKFLKIWMLCALALNLIYMFYSILFFSNELYVVIRIVRNIIYIYLFYKISSMIFKKINIDKLILYTSFLVASCTIIYYYALVSQYQEYMLYRNSEIFLVMSFGYLLSIAIAKKMSWFYNFIYIVTLVTIFLSIFVQQNRVQIVALLATTLVVVIYTMSINIYRIENLKTIFSNVFKYSIICIVLIVGISKYVNFSFINGLVNNYITYRINVIYHNNGFVLDSSLSNRVEEYKEIIREISHNIIYLVFGKGYGYEYWPQTYVVDSFWFWILLNMGIIGIILFGTLFLYLLGQTLVNIKHVNKTKMLAVILSVFIMSLTIPAMIWSISDVIAFGLALAIFDHFLKEPC